jgi:NAD(P)-dependent dehydrogenase (short-subunit alcohol dehydrogenase family)
MRDLAGKVAVVTGGGSGIGSGLCRRFAAAGMQVVVADVDGAAAENVANALRGEGARACAVATDVADPAAVERLAETTVREMGGVHLVCNNAGVCIGGPLPEATEGDWQWLVSVNLLGVVNGCRAFVPRLVEQGEGHVVNTASIGGFLPYAGLAVYCTTKFAIVGFSEALRQEIEPAGIGVSILCPGGVRTNLAASDRLRPGAFGVAGGTSKVLDGLLAEAGDAIDPQLVGDCVIRGVEENAEYIFTHPGYRDLFEERFRKVLAAFDTR